MKSILIGLAALMLMVAAIAAGAQNERDIERQLRAAMDTEVLDRNPRAAIERYKKIAGSGIPRLEAQALLRMADCYRQLGDSEEAQRIYARIVRNYGNHPEAVAIAQPRLRNLESGPPPAAIALKGPTWLQDVAVAISPDGRHLLSGRGVKRDLVTGEQRTISDSPDLVFSHAVFSSDGQQVAYSPESQDGGTGHDTGPEIRVVSVSATGGRDKLVFRNDEFVGAAPFGWSPDGEDIFAILTLQDKTNVIAAIATDNGSFRRIKSLEWRWPDKLSLSPDGRYIAYDALLAKDSTNRDIFLLSTDGSEAPLVQHPARDATPVWTPDGKAVVFTTDRSKITELWMIQVADGKPKGTPELLRPKERRAPAGPIFPIGFSADGSFYYSAGSTLFSDVYTAEVDLAAETVTRPEARLDSSFAGRNAGSAYSPDGKSLAYFSRRGATFNISPWRQNYGFLTIVVRTLATGRDDREIQTIFTSASSPAWMPDGSLVFAGHTDADLYETYSLHRIDLNTGKDLINRAVSAVLGVAVSPEGKKIYYTDDNPTRIMVYDVESERETELFKGSLRLANWGPNMVLSPDGQQIAFEAQSRPGSRTVIMPASGGTLRELAVADKLGVRPMQWSNDGKRILVQRGTGGGRANGWWWVPVDGGAPHAMGSGLSFQIESIHPDGKQVSTTRYGSSPDGQPGVWVDPDLLPNREGHNVFTAEIDAASGKVRASAIPVTQSLIFSDHGAVWLPDGKSIAFGRSQPDNPQRLALVERSMENGAEKIYGITNNQNWFKSLIWFHDSKSLLLYRNQTSGSGFERLDAEKATRSPVANLDFKSGIEMAALSPDDQTLYVANNEPKTRSIVAVDLTTGKEKHRFTVPNAPDPISALSLSPDGKRLAILTEKGLSRIGVDGRDHQTLYKAVGPATTNVRPVWTRNGAILIALNERANRWRILRVPAEGSGKPTLTGLEVTDLESFDLSPDGTRIVFDGVRPTISSGNPR